MRGKLVAIPPEQGEVLRTWALASMDWPDV
jgi:hypothetical protein